MKWEVVDFFPEHYNNVEKIMKSVNTGGIVLLSVIIVIALHLMAINSFGRTQSDGSDLKSYEPLYHFYPSGDPTGLFYHNGYFYNNWGSAISKDLVHWEFTGFGEQRIIYNKARQDDSISSEELESLRPTRLGGSGTVVIDSQNTSRLGEDGKVPFVSLWHNNTEPWFKQKIGLGYTLKPGVEWNRYETFPVLDIDSREFRDPHVFWHEPTEKWIMAIGEAEIPKVKFFSSENLKDWKFMSDWGPWGAVGGVWECVDLFPLAVDGDPDHVKWVLVVSVQPLSGQYFIGEFDGEKFTLDPEFAQALTYEKYVPRGEVLFDFETGHDEWIMEGNAFVESPSSKALYKQSAIMGFKGRYFVNSGHDRATSTGKITSPEFKITKNYMNFLVSGRYAPEEVSVNLIVDGRVERSQTGNNSRGMQWVSWNISEFRGQKAVIEIVDNVTTGEILVDHIMLGDEPARNELEKAFWFDYGPDFYAVKSWNNYPEEETRQIWTAWMGSWRYAGQEPVPRIQSIPRSVELKTFLEGIRLVQKPIAELKTLRTSPKSVDENVFEGLWTPEDITPSRNAYELQVEFENINSSEFGLKLAVGNNEQTVVGYRVEKEELYVDRRDSGYDDFSGLFPKIYSGPLKNRTNTVKLHIFVDRSSVEVFGNDGETVLSSKFYPDPESLGIELFSTRGEVKVTSMELWELESINVGIKSN